ncbi:hypothetical protein WMY93_006590 [Mugilogobius chulae]|uniref:Arginine vasopressin-induced protein 1 n=1 Tax=Mugilogobius chulae TaxID=88201 RepID=A0AAW0PK99_9GOBI
MSDSTSTSSADESCSLWVLTGNRSRKSGYSNIFSGVNIHQLQRLFQAAGDRDAEHRARLVWKRSDDEDDDDEVQQTDGVKKAQSTEEAAGLAQALVGLRICARTKAGVRAEVPTREHKWYNASPYMQQVKYIQIKDAFSGYSVMKEDINTETNATFSTEEKISSNSNHSNSSSRRLGGRVNTRDSDQYLHRILH